MQITLNGKPEQTADRATIADLLRDRNLAGSPCAVEVNTKLIPRREHPETHLRPGDAVEIVTLVGGG